MAAEQPASEQSTFREPASGDASLAPVIHEVSGVPVLTLPPGTRAADGAGPGTVTGGLFFRVGTADETVPLAGITHLIEHLAIGRVRTGEADENGQTGARWTLFHATGRTDEVVAHLNGICAALHALPFERMEAEKHIIRTEAARRSEASPMLSERYGAAGYGMAALAEFGMFKVTEDEVRDWARRWFTRGNVVAFVTTDELPAGLQLQLPPGPRQPDPEPGEWVARTPAQFSRGSGGIMLESVVDRSPAAQVYSRMMAARLFRTLREERGLSYVADADYATRDGATATVTMVADALPDKTVELSGAFLEVVRGSLTGAIAADELAAAIRAAQRDLDSATPQAFLPTQAIAVLDGREVPTPSGVVRRLGEVTGEQVRAVAEQVWRTAMINCDPAASAVVSELGVEPARYPAHAAVRTSTTFKKGGFANEWMLFGDHGITYREGRASHTVMFDEVRAVLCWPDGGRVLVARDASSMVIEPGLYVGLNRKQMPSLLDDKVSPDKLVELPARDTKAVPRFGVKQQAYITALIIVGSLGLVLLVAAIVAGVTAGPEVGIGLTVLGAPFWIATAWMFAAERRRSR